METEHVIIDENDVWISIDSLRISTQNGIEEQEGQFLCYISFKEPNIFFGDLLRDDARKIILFENRADAREAAINFTRGIL